MSTPLNRRNFVKATVLASATAPIAAMAQPPAIPPGASPLSGPLPAPVESLPTGRIGSVEFSRLMLGGNLISGYAHSRDLTYVAYLAKRYNTDAKIAETLELAETHGINVINSWVKDGIAHLHQHWKRGGKMKWISQIRPNANGDLEQINQAADLGAAGIHVTGDAADALIRDGHLDTIARMMELIRRHKRLAGVGAHGLGVVVECEKARLNPDFYVKTLHTHDYHTAPKPGETEDLGRYDNSWCKDPEEVVDVMFRVKQPWIAFKVMAAGAIPPQRAFPHAFDSGADFVLAGMFDWQVAEDVKIAKEAFANRKRTRPTPA